jgi:hypothetical protein
MEGIVKITDVRTFAETLVFGHVWVVVREEKMSSYTLLQTIIRAMLHMNQHLDIQCNEAHDTRLFQQYIPSRLSMQSKCH